METESTERLEELPIFPLATVLFPGAILPLHIFEERYKQMFRYAVDNSGLFGLSYRDDAFIGRDTPPEIGSIGCLARINAVMPLEEGKMNVISTGVIRYRVLGFSQTQPFLLARVDPITDDLEADDGLERLFQETVEIAKKFLDAAQTLDETAVPIDQDLPEDPEAFSLLIASALPVDNALKQNLLEMTSTKLRLTRLRQYLTNALSQYNERLRIQEMARSNGHGRLH